MGFLIRFHKSISILLNLICEKNYGKREFSGLFFSILDRKIIFRIKIESLIEVVIRNPYLRRFWENSYQNLCIYNGKSWKVSMQSIMSKSGARRRASCFPEKTRRASIPPSYTVVFLYFSSEIFKVALRVMYPIAIAFLLACDKQRGFAKDTISSAINRAGFPGNDVFTLTLLSCPRS